MKFRYDKKGSIFLSLFLWFESVEQYKRRSASGRVTVSIVAWQFTCHQQITTTNWSEASLPAQTGSDATQ